MTWQQGVVLKRMKSFYYVDVEGSPQLCRVKGNLFKKSRFDQQIAVGDWVEFDPQASEDAGLIYRILPRKSKLSRSKKNSQLEQVLVSNVDYLWIVSSFQAPELRYGLIDRCIVVAEKGNLQPILVFNKTDLGTNEQFQEIKEIYHDLGYPLFFTCIPKKEGISQLHDLARQGNIALAGHSGVGKSSLIQAMFPHWQIRIGEVSAVTQKGQHTTTLTEMYRMPNGGYLVDTPGIRELGVYELSPQGLDQYFKEFSAFVQDCHFSSCTHLHEPHCGVKLGVKEGKIHPKRYASYCSIYQSLEER